ncbi:MAG: C26 family cysteine hydrolase domain-containing family [Rhodospirillales bacterium]|jgi:putative glutamine amidotransferase|nr:C26 family cysteine hydrolase domain-containing family [Rhodospirillales bacterium]MBT4626127.1 C26 family cysteine hydrolase domain-containing family [Rhodospirillales bacterium]MBT5522267.1 C26 family cysteine hydrolase domain-containing family [Rhodospirillales bacterium]MBT6109386.1 C26 family cysteine hydrolase domain-containing family [Rhodospirillales bacterium]
MITIAVNQRVEIHSNVNERRDCLDQRWAGFLLTAGFNQLLLPNHPLMASRLLSNFQIDGILLTGGGNTRAYGGTAPERDDVEDTLIEHALAKGIPIVGVCRGMQVIQSYFDVPLQTVDGHVCAQQTIEINGAREDVNSYHDLGTTTTCPQLDVWARSDDGVVKAIRHRDHNLLGIMWHPERLGPFRREDLALFRTVFGS